MPSFAHQCDTRLTAYLGVHGSIQDLSVTDPDDGGGRLGVVGVAGEVQRVSSPQAHHGTTADDWVLRWNCREKGIMGDDVCVRRVGVGKEVSG